MSQSEIPHVHFLHRHRVPTVLCILYSLILVLYSTSQDPAIHWRSYSGSISQNAIPVSYLNWTPFTRSWHIWAADQDQFRDWSFQGKLGNKIIQRKISARLIIRLDRHECQCRLERPNGYSWFWFLSFCFPLLRLKKSKLEAPFSHLGDSTIWLLHLLYHNCDFTSKAQHYFQSVYLGPEMK